MLKEKKIKPKKSKHQSHKKKKSGWKMATFWFWFFIVVLIMCTMGLIMIYIESTKLERTIKQAAPVHSLNQKTTGLVALTGRLATDHPAVSKYLTGNYALLYRQAYKWDCGGRGSCEYEGDALTRITPKSTVKVDGTILQGQHFRLYTGHLNLIPSVGIVSPHWSDYVIENGLLIEKEEQSLAFGFLGISNGRKVTVIGKAKNGILTPVEVLLNDKEVPGFLVGLSKEQMLVEESSRQDRLLWSLVIIYIIFIPITYLLKPETMKITKRKKK